MKQDWLDFVAKTFPEGRPAGFPDYPLLGPELPLSPDALAPRRPWRIRLVLRQAFSAEYLGALTEDVEELGLEGPAVSSPLDGLSASVEDLFLDDEGSAGSSSRPWMRTLREDIPSATGFLAGTATIWAREAVCMREAVYLPDTQVLRNLAFLDALGSERGDFERWGVVSSVSATGEAENLIADTLAYWSGAVAGAHFLQVSQQPDEGFDSLWARLSILRLLRWEAGLGQPCDHLGGAGFFAALRDRA